MPPLSALRAFEAAARHMSFQAAATELGVTPTAISHQVRFLERLCGQALFRRRPRPLALTVTGARLFPAVRDSFDGLAVAVSAARADAGQLPLRVTTTNAFASRYLVPRLPLWQIAHPNFSLEIIGTDAVLDLRGGDADLAIRYASDPPPDLVAQELFRDRFWPICSPGLLATTGPIRRPSDLACHTLIHIYWHHSESIAPTWRHWLAVARAMDPGMPDFKPAGELSFREELHAIEAVIAGQGIAICSDILVARELESGVLIKAIDIALPGFGFYLVFPPDGPRRAVVDAFCCHVLTPSHMPACRAIRSGRASQAERRDGTGWGGSTNGGNRRLASDRNVDRHSLRRAAVEPWRARIGPGLPLTSCPMRHCFRRHVPSAARRSRSSSHV